MNVQGYVKAGQYQIALDNLKWVTDYFIKCVGNGNEIVAQVGNGAQDHAVWGRPEDVSGSVPVYTLTKDRPGSDVVGAMGAALAAASVAFKGVDRAYSDRLLDAAIKAYKCVRCVAGLTAGGKASCHHACAPAIDCAPLHSNMQARHHMHARQPLRLPF